MQKSAIFPEIKKRNLISFILLLVNLYLRAQNPLGFEAGLDQIDPGAMAWRVEEYPPDRWGVDSLNPITGDLSLHHTYNNPRAGCDYFVLFHHSFLQGDSLSFSFRLRFGYPPSSGNNWQVAILADFDDGISDGLALGVNLEGSDDMLKIWRVRDGLYEELCSSQLNYQEEIGSEKAPLFKLTWQWDGRLSLFYALDPESELSEIGSCLLHDLPEGRSLVVRYEYSAAQDRKLWLDNFHLKGNFAADTLAPRVSGLVLETSNEIRLDFSEGIAWSDTAAYIVFPYGEGDKPSPENGIIPDSLTLEGSALRLFFNVPFPNRELLDLLVKGVCDLDGNCMKDTLLAFMRNEAEWGDVVINELMADPDPPMSLALDEYVEFFNRSQYPITMAGWWLEVGTRMYPLTGEMQDLELNPGAYRVFQDISLPNQGSLLGLYSREGKLVHAASYELPYDAPSWKLEGGWSLESPDPSCFCSTSRLWEYSLDHRGGSPGEVNSIRFDCLDEQAPLFLYFGYEVGGGISFHFSEKFVLDADLGQRVILNPGNYRAMDLRAAHILGEKLACSFAVEPSKLQTYSIYLPAVSDCYGNLSREMKFNGGLARAPVVGSIVINEIMYDPRDGEAEYIELFNAGTYFVDLAALGFDVSIADEGQNELEVLSDHSRILAPGAYVVLTGSIQHLMASYGLENSGKWVEVADFESLPNGEGRIWLSDRAGNVIDAVFYKKNMHMDLISDTRGIALERINPGAPGNDSSNWHSAASIEDYSTPGHINSQMITGNISKPELVQEPRIFSPDNDGYNDFLVISPGLDEPGCVLRLWITGTGGTMVRMLANNHLSGSHSQYVWDGRMDNGQMAAGGFYIVHLRTYNPGSGASQNLKCAVGLVYR